MCCLISHGYMHSFRSFFDRSYWKLKQPGNFPGGGSIWTAFRSSEGEFEQTFSKNSNALGVARGGGGGDLEASIWLVYYFRVL